MTTPQKWILFGALKLVVLGAAFAILYSIYGCNTVRGVGQDIQQAGVTIEKAGSR